MAWTDIPDSVIEAGKPIRAIDGRALRDNVPALAAGDTGAPPVKAGWHPYDMVSIGDASDGVIYDRAVDPAVSSVEAPLFETGYEYAIVVDNMKPSTNANFLLDLYFETSAAWVNATTDNFGAATVSNFHFQILAPDLASRWQTVFSLGLTPSMNTAFSGTTLQKVTKARLRTTAGTFAEGRMRMFKRGGLLNG